MIICHRHRFIFIKTRKTAGTSVEIALAALCGPEDVLSPISPEDEAIRTQRGYRPAQNFMVSWSRYGPLDWARLLARGHRPRFFNHAPASYIMQYVAGDTWRSYYKFCFERNPWDKVVSSFFWERKRAPGLQLSRFVLSGAANKVADFDMYSVRGELVVDDVLPYENLAGALQQVFARVGATASPDLPRAKGGERKDRRPYTELLGEAEREKVGRVFAREIAHFGYRW